MNIKKIVLICILATTGCSKDIISERMLERDVNAYRPNGLELVTLMYEAKEKALANPTEENLRHFRRLGRMIGEMKRMVNEMN